MHIQPSADRRLRLTFAVLLISLLLFMAAILVNSTRAQESDAQTTATPTSSMTPTASSTGTASASATATATTTATATLTTTITASPTPTLQPTAQASETPVGSPTATATEEASPTTTPTPTATIAHFANLRFLPALFSPRQEALLTPIRVTALPPIDFEAVRQDAQLKGYDIAYNKIGFHVGVGGNRAGLDDWMTALDNAGVPIVLKSANDAEPLFKAQELMKQSGVPHVLIYRDATHAIDNPQYNLPPQQAADLSWQANTAAFPPELDPSLVWMETVNEPDKNRAAWLAEFSLASAQKAVSEGKKYAAFGWSSGEPEPEDWESPEMLAFLAYAAAHPDQVAVALHEYSFQNGLISEGYPWLIGRFQKLFAAADKHGIPRPTVIITEWGWEYNSVPSVNQGMEDINWNAWLYADYPQVLGAAIWYLGPGFSDIDEHTQKYIAPVTEYSLSNYFIYDPLQRPIDEDLYVPDPPTVRIVSIR